MWRKQNRSTKPMTRPVKGDCERKRRMKVQQRRLVALGVPEKTVAKLNSAEVRQMLKRPLKTAKSVRK